MVEFFWLSFREEWGLVVKSSLSRPCMCQSRFQKHQSLRTLSALSAACVVALCVLNASLAITASSAV